MAKKAREILAAETAQPQTCTCCGKTYNNPLGNFFKQPNSWMWKNNGGYTGVCKSCLEIQFAKHMKLYGDQKFATIATCHYLDIPFYHSLYDSIAESNRDFGIGYYVRVAVTNKQYINKTFVDTLIEKELEKTVQEIRAEKEVKWTSAEIRSQNEVIELIGYDPFEGYPDIDRRFLFSELVKYFDDEILEDTYKLSQVIQIVNNNNQIRQYDVIISQMDPVTNANNIKELNNLKKSLVSSNDKMAKENEISVKNRSNKDAGKSTLTFLMKDLREKDFTQAEANYYDQLRSQGTQWALDMSNRSILQHAMFDENDKQEVFEIQRDMIQDIQAKLDEALEKNRLLLIENERLMNQK